MRNEHLRWPIGMILCLTLTVGNVFGQEERVIANLVWEEISDAEQLQSGELVTDKSTGEQTVMISRSDSSAVLFPLVEILEPEIASSNYAIRGQIRYEGVSGAGFLEMWNYFADGSHYVSRTLGTGGPMQLISGDSAWRDFILPFDLGADPEQAKPNRLVINLMLPESGTVWVSDLELVEFEPPPRTSQTAGAWWSDRTAGMIGGGIGSLLGILLGLAGTLIGIGRGRAFVTIVLAGTAVLGAVCLIGGFVALAVQQPYAVTYPLFLIGVLGLLFGVGGLPMSRVWYRQRELRQMQALDAQITSAT